MIDSKSRAGERIFKFSPPSGLVVDRCASRIDAAEVNPIHAERTNGTRAVIVVHDGFKCRLTDLRVLDRGEIALVAEASNEREVARAESACLRTVFLAVHHAEPTVIKDAVQVRGAINRLGRQVEQDGAAGRLRGRG